MEWKIGQSYAFQSYANQIWGSVRRGQIETSWSFESGPSVPFLIPFLEPGLNLIVALIFLTIFWTILPHVLDLNRKKKEIWDLSAKPWNKLEWKWVWHSYLLQLKIINEKKKTLTWLRNSCIDVNDNEDGNDDGIKSWTMALTTIETMTVMTTMTMTALKRRRE